MDLVYYDNQRQLEYDFLVAPGADPRQIELSFAGAKLRGRDRSHRRLESSALLSLIGGPVQRSRARGMKPKPRLRFICPGSVFMRTRPPRFSHTAVRPAPFAPATSVVRLSPTCHTFSGSTSSLATAERSGAVADEGISRQRSVRRLVMPRVFRSPDAFLRGQFSVNPLRK